MICQKLMSNDACNFVILYMVCKIDKIFHENYWSKMGYFINDFDGKLRNLYFFQGQKYTSFGKNILHRQSASLGHSATGHSESLKIR